MKKVKKKANSYLKVVGMYTTSDIVRATGCDRRTIETYIGLPTHSVGSLRRKYFSGEVFTAIVGKLTNIPKE